MLEGEVTNPLIRIHEPVFENRDLHLPYGHGTWAIFIQNFIGLLFQSPWPHPPLKYFLIFVQLKKDETKREREMRRKTILQYIWYSIRGAENNYSQSGSTETY